jgi:hypothetical protein
LSSESESSSDDVFVNCPFDNDYAPMFQALVFTIFACGFRARSALEVDDGGEARIEKLYRVVEQCRYGIHDLSRTELDKIHGLPRFNMPLELGIFLGAKRFGRPAQRLKRTLVLDVEPHRYERFISDLKGMDIKDHGGDPRRAVQQTRDWLANVSRRKIAGTTLMVAAYERFATDLPQIAVRLGFKPGAIPYVDFEGMVTTWLLEST